MGQYLWREVKNLLQATAPFTHRLAKLEELTSELFANVEPESLAELRDWFKEASRLKQLRNDYEHGRWGVPLSAIENPSLIDFVPLHWNMDPQAAAVPKVMTIDQFEQEVATLQDLPGQRRLQADEEVRKVGGAPSSVALWR